MKYEIDNILRNIQDWTRAYINNIIYGRNFLADLLYKFRILFEIFLHYNISIKQTKLYLNYLDFGFLAGKSIFWSWQLQMESWKPFISYNTLWF